MKIYLAEFIGTCFLLMIVVGSGIMGQNLTNNEAITLLGNTISTGAGLTALIWMLSKISGAHFNPAVSLVFYLNKQINIKIFFGYTLCQIFGAVLGTLLANYIFGLEIFQFSQNIREGFNIFLSEAIATFGLILVILRVSDLNSLMVAPAVGLYITSAYWFTSSTSFANPAVTIGRMFSDTFTGIDPLNVIYFIGFQVLGALLAFQVNKVFKAN